MKDLLKKLEALVDEATLLVREERQRRNLGGRGVDLFGPQGTEIRWDLANPRFSAPLDRTGCAPNHWPAWSDTVVIGGPSKVE